ncbi:hypothetical protein BSKO_13911 [Bryopsis sp. KO-2023]|nr:hypothetical protein BSKO_13911 [Bryopsis sp. KO-2023]
MSFVSHQSSLFTGRLSRPARRAPVRLQQSLRVHRPRGFRSVAVRAENSEVVQDASSESATAAVPANPVKKNSSIVKKVNAEELEVAIQNRDRPMVVDFYADWCGPCVLMADELVKVAEELGDSVQILKIDTEENPELSSQLKIQGLPTIMMISTEAGKPALRLEGLIPAKTVVDIIATEL